MIFSARWVFSHPIEWKQIVGLAYGIHKMPQQFAFYADVPRFTM